MFYMQWCKWTWQVPRSMSPLLPVVKALIGLLKLQVLKYASSIFTMKLKLILWPYFYFYLLHSLIPSWTKDSICVRVVLIGWKQPQLAFPLSWGRCEEQMIRVTPVPVGCCKEEKGLRQLCGSVLIPQGLSLPFLSSYLELFRPTHTLSAAIKYICQAWQTDRIYHAMWETDFVYSLQMTELLEAQ